MQCGIDGGLIGWEAGLGVPVEVGMPVEGAQDEEVALSRGGDGLGGCRVGLGQFLALGLF